MVIMTNGKNHTNTGGCYDLNVPLPSSSSKQELQNLALTFQARLHQLGYHGLAFCHTAFNGRLRAEKDDADVALPWKLLLPSSLPSASLKSSSSSLSSSPSLSSSSLATNTKKGDGNIKIKQNTPPNIKFSRFGRTNSLTGMKIFRRLNIIVEEASDVSRILLNHAAAGGAAQNGTNSHHYNEIPSILQKYDFISLQPMNESVLQCICELLASSAAASSVTSSTNNTKFIDIIVLEYATGARGGYCLPYKVRREYLENALRAGMTFELCYGTAMLDMKRRQGFLRALIDFQSAYNGIQKKHMIMNNRQLLERAKKRGRMKKSLSKYKIPLLLSSGSRQNYTLGTADEGTLALRGPHDVNCLILHLVGMGEVEVIADFDAGDSDGGADISRRNKRKECEERGGGEISATERILARAHGRAMGKVMIDESGVVASVHSQSFAQDSKLFQHQQNHVDNLYDNVDDEDDEEEEDNRGFSCVIDWLSAPLMRKRNATAGVKDENQPAHSLPVNDEDATLSRASAVNSPPPENNSLERYHDLEDGFMAI